MPLHEIIDNMVSSYIVMSLLFIISFALIYKNITKNEFMQRIDEYEKENKKLRQLVDEAIMKKLLKG